MADDLRERVAQDAAQAADHTGVQGKDLPAVIAMMEEAGWRNNDLVGFGEAVRASPRAMARWLIGQAINCMQSGLGPHPITQKFAEDYRKMRPTTPLTPPEATDER